MSDGAAAYVRWPTLLGHYCHGQWRTHRPPLSHHRHDNCRSLLFLLANASECSRCCTVKRIITCSARGCHTYNCHDITDDFLLHAFLLASCRHNDELLDLLPRALEPYGGRGRQHSRSALERGLRTSPSLQFTKWK